MRKRSRYRPKPVMTNPVAYVIESVTPAAKHDSYLLDLKIKNHGSMHALTHGLATRGDMDVLIAMCNMVEALWSLGFGKDFEDVVVQGQASLLAVGKRGLSTGRFILRGPEMAALNLLMELHDAQMEVVTVGDIERGVELVHKRVRAGQIERIAA